MSEKIVEQAARKGDFETIRNLYLKEGEDSLTDKKWKSAFFIACEKGFDEIVEFLVKSGIPVDIREEIEIGENKDEDDDDGDVEYHHRSGLIIAIQNGRLSTVKLLIKLNINLNLLDSNGSSALINATAAVPVSENLQILKLLMRQNIKLNLRNDWGTTAFMAACENGVSTDVLSFLLRKKVGNVNDVDDEGKTALMMAVDCGHDSVVKMLLEYGADVNVVTKSNNSALRCACPGFASKDDIIEMLVKHGANIQPQMTRIIPDVNSDNFHSDPFELLCYFNRLDAVDILLREGEAKHLGRDYFFSGFQEACLRGFPKLVEKLVKVSFLSEWNSDESMPLLIGCEYGNDSVVEVILQHLPHQAYLFDYRNKTALMVASIGGWASIVDLILQYCPFCVDLKDSKHTTALMLAVENKRENIVEKLLTFKANINAKNINGETALMMACSDDKNVDIIKKLLSFKANIDAVDNKGESAFSRACLNRHFLIAKMLIDHGAELTNPILSKLLITACKHGREDVVKFLLSLKPECIELYGRQAIQKAFLKESFPLVKLFIELGVSIDYCRFTKRGYRNKTVLMNCLTWKQSVQIVHFLLENKLVNVNERNKHGKTPIVCALQKGNAVETIKVLLNHGAVLDLKDEFTFSIFQEMDYNGYGSRAYSSTIYETVYLLIEHGLDPSPLIKTNLLSGVLILACSKGNVEVVKLLLIINSCPENRNPYLSRHFAEGLTLAVKSKHSEIVNYLVKEGIVDVNLQETYYSKRSLLIVACENNDEEMFNILIGYGADAEYQDAGGTPLMFAVRKGNEKFVDLLMRSGCNVDTANSDQKTALILACELQGREMVKKLLDYGANVNFVDKKGNTPLIHACRRGVKGIVELLLYYKVDVNMKNLTDINKSAMHYVLKDQNESIICLLLKYGADINTRVAGGRTLLMFAAQRRMVLLTKLLITKGVDVRAKSRLKFRRNTINPYKTALGFACNQPYSPEGTEIVKLLLKADKRCVKLSGHDFHYPIICAATHGNLKLMKFLLNYSPVVDINVVDKNGRSALMFAAEKGYVDVIDFLVTRGAKNDVCDHTGMTAFMYATKNGHVQCVKKLTNGLHGLNDIDHNGSTTLMFACEVGNEDIVKFILGCNPDVNIQNNNKQTALMFACMKGSANIVHRLLHRGALLNIVDNEGHTALDLACDKGHHQVLWLLLWAGAIINTSTLIKTCMVGFHEVVARLLEYGADVNTLDGNGMTVLMHACVHARFAVVQDLLHQGANPNLKDHNKQTALMHASIHCQTPDVLDLLIHYKAEIDAVDNTGKTALMHACIRKDKTLVRSLIEAGADVNAHDNANSSVFSFLCSKWNACDVHYLTATNLNIKCFSDSYDFSCQYRGIEEMLLYLGLNVNTRAGNGTTAIMWAASTHDVEEKDSHFIHLLLKLGANLDVTDDDGLSVFGHAMQGDGTRMQMLIDSGKLFVEGSKSKLKSIHLQAMKNLTKENVSLDALLVAMRNNVFDWSWCPLQMTSQVGYEALKLGFSPCPYFYSNKFQLSPLVSAVSERNFSLAEEFINHFYYFQNDLQVLMRHSQLWSEMPKSLQEKITEGVFNLQHKSLLSISMAITTAGSPTDRSEIVDALHIPDKLKQILKFKNFVDNPMNPLIRERIQNNHHNHRRRHFRSCSSEEYFDFEESGSDDDYFYL